MKLPVMPPVPAYYMRVDAEGYYNMTPDPIGAYCYSHDVDALRTAASAYLEALRVAVEALNEAKYHLGMDRPINPTGTIDEALASLGKLPERAP